MNVLARPAVLLAVLALALAGCSSGSDGSAEPSASSSASASLPTDPAALQAALPTLEQVPGGTKVDLQCPQDEDRCAAQDGFTSYALGAEVEAAGDAAQIERNGTTSTPNDVAVASITLHDDAEAATRYLAQQRTAQEATEGSFDIPAKPVDGGGQIPAISGTGTLADITVQGLSGYLSSYTLDSETTDDPAQRVALLVVQDGRVLVSSFVSLSVPGRDADAAEQLTKRLVGDTVERLRSGGSTP